MKPKSGIGPSLPFSKGLPGAFKPSFRNIAGQTAALTGAGFAYDALTDSAEQSAVPPPAGSGGPVEATPGGPAGMTIEEGEKAGIIKDQKEKATDTAADTTNKNIQGGDLDDFIKERICLLYTSPSPRDGLLSRMPSSA